MLDGTGQLLPGESIVVRVVMEVDPDDPSANYSTTDELLNQ